MLIVLPGMDGILTLAGKAWPKLTNLTLAIEQLWDHLN